MIFINMPYVWIMAWVAVSMACVFAKSAYFSLNPFLDLYAPAQTNNPQCYAAVLIFKKHVEQRTPWALKMLDASSKIPPSLLAGNTHDLGNFDECLAVRSDGNATSINIMGKYCLVKVAFNRTNDTATEEVTVGDLAETWSLAVCMPATCTQADLTEQLTFALGDTATDIKVGFCRSSLDNTGLPLTSLIVIGFVLLLLLFVILGTLMERKLIKIPHQFTNSALLLFSLITNWKALFGSPSTDMIGSIYGIQVISMLGILAAHTVKTTAKLCINRNSEADKPYVFSHPVIRLCAAAVDAFFLTSGVVLGRGFMVQKDEAQTSFSYFRYVVYRLLRITPPYVFVLGSYMTLYQSFGSGPLWETVTGPQMTNCLNNWWTNLLFINNYNKMDTKCMYWTWYLGAAMQMHLVAPVFIFALYKNHKLGIACVVIASALSCLYTFQLSFSKHIFSFPVAFRSWDAYYKLYFQYIHEPTQTRVSPYFIGILFGYFLEYFKKEKITICSLSRVLGWIVSPIILITVIYFPTIGFEWGFGPVVCSLFEATYRAFFGAAFGWVIFACDLGYGGAVNRFLSHHCFRVLSRLTFCFYLIHPIAIEYELATRRAPVFFSYYFLFQNMVFDVVLVLFGAVFLAFTVEYPSVRLIKLIFKKKEK